MTSFVRTITVARGVFAPGHLGELTQYLPFELVDDVLARSRAVQGRLRLLPSRVGVYFVLALAVFPAVGYLGVWGKLVAGLGPLAPVRPCEKALRDLRRRIGAAPLQMLFETVAGPIAQPRTPGVCYRKWRTVAFDGCSSLRAPDQPRVRAWLGKILNAGYGPEGYPHLRLMALCETGTRGLLGAVFGPTSKGETHYARRLLPLLNATMLVLADRAFAGNDFLIDTADTGAQLLVRLNSRRRPTVFTALPDGSFLTRFQDRTFRIINVDITATCDDGTRISDHYMLITTLLDHSTDPAERLARLYHERWEVESAFLALRHTLLTGRVLRSCDACGLEQELWAWLTVHQVLRRAMCDAAESRPGTDPDRASFTIALQAAADQIVDACGITGDDSDGGGIARAVLAGLLPARRPRISARKVKCPMSRYGTTQNETRPLSSHSFNRLDITVLAATEQPTALPPSPANTDRRSHVFRLLAAADPGQDWTPRQIADALKIDHIRSLSAQMGQWITQKFLIRSGHGRYRLHPQWVKTPQPPAGSRDSTATIPA
ncbi:IS4 family transposase [Streptomyces sp. NBC_01445]|nr:IS4 family transposase [Streptomyces sp. NBC_01445]WSE03846.1 IS4 family transposase [Streptomyces sp. NBC_01445]WSE04051.1 IS4 family transposase [Streptomyces sp. NBC_01445]